MAAQAVLCALLRSLAEPAQTHTPWRNPLLVLIAGVFVAAKPQHVVDGFLRLIPSGEGDHQQSIGAQYYY